MSIGFTPSRYAFRLLIGSNQLRAQILPQPQSLFSLLR